MLLYYTDNTISIAKVTLEGVSQGKPGLASSHVYHSYKHIAAIIIILNVSLSL